MKPKARAKPTRAAELCRWRGPCFAPRSKGRAENCANVRHADLRLGKGQSRRQKAIRFSDKHHRLKHRRCNAPVADIISLTNSYRFDLTRTDLGSMAGRRSAGISKKRSTSTRSSCCLLKQHDIEQIVQILTIQCAHGLPAYTSILDYLAYFDSYHLSLIITVIMTRRFFISFENRCIR